MNICVVYDDLTPVPDEVQSLVGVSRFSAVLYRKRSLLAHLNELMQSVGVREFVHIQRTADLDRLRAHVADAPPTQRYLYYPSHVVPRDLGEAARFLQKVQYSRRNLVIPVEERAGAPPILLLDRERAHAMLGVLARRDWGEFLRNAEEYALATLRNDARLRDISTYARFVEFLSSNFDVRHFNEIGGDDFAVRKRSADKAKMRREYRFHTLLEGPVQAFFLRPFDYAEDEGGASYRAERLHVPDASIQWIHGAFSEEEFADFLERVSRFLRVRPMRDASREAFNREAERLYAGKVTERLAAFRASPSFSVVQGLLERRSPSCTLDALAERWRCLWAALRPERLQARLAFTHGDLCFSNILFDKRTRLLKFIDPRGADTSDELFSHPYYDAAKLSHSVLGGYDFINHNLFEIAFDDALGIELRVLAPDVGARQRAFVEIMRSLGFDYAIMRLCEASLFLSMLPLHADVPKKTLAFALTAEKIIAGLEAGAAPGIEIEPAPPTARTTVHEAAPRLRSS